MLVIPALGMLRQEDGEFKASLGFIGDAVYKTKPNKIKQKNPINQNQNQTKKPKTKSPLKKKKTKKTKQHKPDCNALDC
jgi:hypothetical protein